MVSWALRVPGFWILCWLMGGLLGDVTGNSGLLGDVTGNDGLLGGVVGMRVS